ncbi:MAG: aldehyde reductase [Saprospiraceae bacterium]|nr:aldehyde reductase [Saprospiraceae bacterium]
MLKQNVPVLITGGTGYIASWIIKYLLEEGYKVHTTVRNKSNKEKLKHLIDLDNLFPNQLSIFEADLLKKGSFDEAAQGCTLIMHTASPFKVQGLKDPQKELIDPALEGTRNVLTTANNSPSVQRVVLTSSVAAINGDAIDAKDLVKQTLTEENWNTTSNLKHQPYSYSKTVAEQEAWKIAKNQQQWDLVTINPSFVLGPSVTKRKDSTSIDFMLSLAKGKMKMGVPDLMMGMVDVRDVARAHILAAQKQEAQGRYIISNQTLNLLDAAQLMQQHFGDAYPFPKRKLPKFLLYIFGPLQSFTWKYIRSNIGLNFNFDNTKGKKELGLNYKNLQDTLVEHIEQLIDWGYINKR